MNPVIIGDATLYLGDCMDILPTLPKVDAVITDPPYGLGKKMSGGTWATKAPHYKDMHSWDLSAEQIWVDEILKLDVPTVIWGGNYFSVPPSRGWLIWKKPLFPTMADAEMAFTNIDMNTKVMELSRSEDQKQHPTQKPLRLMSWCLDFIPKAEFILDPFMGSGTTGVAAIQMGRKFIGIEREPKYFEIACKRIEQAAAQGKLFEPEPIKQVQESLL